MRNIILVLFTIITLNFNSEVLSQNTYEILFTGEKSSNAYSNILGLEDGSAIVHIGQMTAGASFPNTVEHYMYKISPEGDTVRWDFNKPDTLLSTSEILLDTLDNLIAHGRGFVITNGEVEDRFFWIASITTNFTINWFKPFDFASPEFTHPLSSRLLKLENGEFIHVGITEKIAPTIHERHIFRISSEGDSLQYKLISGSSSGSAIHSLTYSPDSIDLMVHIERFVESAVEISQANGDRVNINTLDSISFFSYPNQNYTPVGMFQTPYTAITYPNNCLIALGDFDYMPAFSPTYHIIKALKYDNGFNLLNEQILAYSNPDIIVKSTLFNAIDFYDPNQIYVSATFGMYGWGLSETNNWIYLAKLDENLDIIWEKYLGGDAYYQNDGMEATSDGGVILGGSRYDENINNPNESDAYVWKLNSDGLVNVENNTSLAIKEAIVFPNPSSDNKLILRTAKTNSTFFLYDVNGIEILNKPIREKQTQIKVTDLPKGQYLWKLVQDKQIVENGKWVKM